MIWPIVQRLGSGQWNRDLWIASVRYQRAGPIALRVEAGLVPSPVGLANYIGRRPHLNPTIAQPSSLFTSLPALEPQAPRANLLGAVYPFGGQVTLSGQHWYGHAAVIDTSPLRRRRISSPGRIRPDSRTSSWAAASRRWSGLASAHRSRTEAGCALAKVPTSPPTWMQPSSPWNRNSRSLTQSWPANGCVISSRRATGESRRHWLVPSGPADARTAMVRRRPRRANVFSARHLARSCVHQRLIGFEEVLGFRSDAGAHATPRPSHAPRIRAAGIRTRPRYRSCGGADGSNGCS